MRKISRSVPHEVAYVGIEPMDFNWTSTNKRDQVRMRPDFSELSYGFASGTGALRLQRRKSSSSLSQLEAGEPRPR